MQIELPQKQQIIITEILNDIQTYLQEVMPPSALYLFGVSKSFQQNISFQLFV